MRQGCLSSSDLLQANLERLTLRHTSFGSRDADSIALAGRADDESLALLFQLGPAVPAAVGLEQAHVIPAAVSHMQSLSATADFCCQQTQANHECSTRSMRTILGTGPDWLTLHGLSSCSFPIVSFGRKPLHQISYGCLLQP